MIAEQWRRKMIQAYHQEALVTGLVGGQRAALRQFSSLATTEAATDGIHSETDHVDDEYASYVHCNRKPDTATNHCNPTQSSRQEPLIATNLEELRFLRNQLLLSTTSSSSSAAGTPLPPTIGFVPTMGSLHEGHLNLVRKAKEEHDIVVVSIYVNPTQFGKNDDLDIYPRNLQQDVQLLSEVSDIIYAPDTSLYHPDHQTWVVPDIDGEYDEGASRPGFFRGVATVVTKLLNHVQPNVAYFGQKDAQQAAVIQDLVRDLDVGVMTGTEGLKIAIVPTVREEDGLAMSSRNAYLSKEDRAQSLVLHEALSQGRQQCLSSTATTTVGEVRQTVLGIMKEKGLTEIEYVTVANVRTTQPMKDDDVIQQQCNTLIIATAVNIGTTRLIDNVVVE